MDGACEHALTGADLAGEEHGRVGPRDLPSRADRALHRRAGRFEELELFRDLAWSLVPMMERAGLADLV
jgi:hypothetical protein